MNYITGSRSRQQGKIGPLPGEKKKKAPFFHLRPADFVVCALVQLPGGGYHEVLGGARLAGGPRAPEPPPAPAQGPPRLQSAGPPRKGVSLLIL